MMSTTQYSISTRNRFQLCDFDEEDPLEILASREKEMETKKKTKLAEKENKVKEPPVKAKPKKEAVKKEVKNPERRFTGENRDDKANITRNEERKNDRNKEERSYDKEFNVSGGENGFEGRRGRGGRGGSNFRGGRGGGGGRGGSRPNFEGKPPKREFDRHSGSNKTGVKPVERKENAPSRITEDFEEAPFETTAEEWTDQPAPETKTDEKPEENEDAPPQVEEARELTLDEWKALKKPKQAPSYNIRKAGEGEDPSQWKKMYALKKNKKSDSEEEYEFDNSEYPQRVGRQKHVLDIDIRFKDTRAPAVRGGRGFRRGGKSQFPGTSSTSHNSSLPKIAPKVDDEHDFPSLN